MKIRAETNETEIEAKNWNHESKTYFLKRQTRANTPRKKQMRKRPMETTLDTTATHVTVRGHRDCPQDRQGGLGDMDPSPETRRPLPAVPQGQGSEPTGGG